MTVIQWFPGHMAKAKKEIEQKLKLVDIVLELVDARIPSSSLNPMFEDILKNKKKIILITKSDMADPNINNKWKTYYKDKPHLLIDAIKGVNVSSIVNLCKQELKDKIKRQKEKGIVNRSIKTMVIGIPNVGKSTLINTLSGRKKAKTGNKPGVTKMQQWIRLNSELDLLDTPGVLWPKFDDKITSYNLALTGAIKDTIVYKDDMTLYFIDLLRERYRSNFENYYSISMDLPNIEILDAIGKKKGYRRNNSTDYERVYEVIINDFRSLKLGRISLEIPIE